MSIFDSHLGVRLKFSWIGIQRQLNSTDVETLATNLSSDPDLLVFKKYTIDTGRESYRKVASVKNKIRKEWIARTLPSLDFGVRLLPKDHVDYFHVTMQKLKEEFTEAVNVFDSEWDAIKEEMKVKLGSLYEESNYCFRPKDCMFFDWTYLTLSLPDSLKEEVYRDELEKFRKRTEATIELIKLSFVSELSDLVNNLVERLSPDPETGEKRRFKAATVNNLKEFLERFRKLDCTNDEKLKEIIDEAERILSGVSPEKLRSDGDVRTRVREEFSRLVKVIDENREVLTTGFSRKLWV